MIASVFRYRAGEPVPVDPALVDAAVPVEDRQVGITQLVEEVRAESAEDQSAFLWIRVTAPEREEMSFLEKVYDLSHLQVDDALNPKQRAKLETTAEEGFIVLKELRYQPETSDVETGQMSAWLGRGYIITARHGEATPHSVRRRLGRHSQLLRYGPICVLYEVCDILVDGYLDILERLDADIEKVEEIVFSESRNYESEMIFHLKRENLEVKRAVAPLAGSVGGLTRERLPNIPEPLWPYFSDIIDHLRRAADMVDSLDQLLVTMLMAANAQQDLRQNRDMRKISAWAAIIAVPTAIAGIYGMNFDNMPELHTQYGYPIVVGTMITVCLLLYGLFKRSGWL